MGDSHFDVAERPFWRSLIAEVFVLWLGLDT